jgi:fructuronate reductase
VRTPLYDRGRVQPGVVHFGPGAFHRVHQACYLDDALAQDSRWGICEVSLQSAGVRDALVPQDGLYTMAVLDEQPSFRVIGSISELLVAVESPAAVIRRLIDPATQLVTATITEKGYCLNIDGGLDLSHADIQHDLQQPQQPRTCVGFLAEGLRLRRSAGAAPPNIISCDNLVDNGKRLRRAVVEFARQHDAGLADWIAAEVPFPCSMVDSITPATDDALRSRVAERLGVTDRWPVQREFFTQWVIEDVMRGAAPDWAALGVAVTNDIGGFERAKLRLLNGAHSSLAYLGSLAGHETVAQAMQDPALAGFVQTLMEQDIKPTVNAPRGLDLQQYIDTILQRFRNPAIRHLLAQIAWDGSQKLPFRLLGTIADAIAAGRPIDRLSKPIAAWFHFIRRKALRNERAVDPLAEKLHGIGAACNGEAAHDVRLFLSLDSVFPAKLAANPVLQTPLEGAYQHLGEAASMASAAS